MGEVVGAMAFEGRLHRFKESREMCEFGGEVCEARVGSTEGASKGVDRRRNLGNTSCQRPNDEDEFR